MYEAWNGISDSAWGMMTALTSALSSVEFVYFSSGGGTKAPGLLNDGDWECNDVLGYKDGGRLIISKLFTGPT